MQLLPGLCLQERIPWPCSMGRGCLSTRDTRGYGFPRLFVRQLELLCLVHWGTGVSWGNALLGYLQSRAPVPQLSGAGPSSCSLPLQAHTSVCLLWKTLLPFPRSKENSLEQQRPPQPGSGWAGGAMTPRPLPVWLAQYGLRERERLLTQTQISSSHINVSGLEPQSEDGVPGRHPTLPRVCLMHRRQAKALRANAPPVGKGRRQTLPRRLLCAPAKCGPCRQTSRRSQPRDLRPPSTLGPEMM